MKIDDVGSVPLPEEVSAEELDAHLKKGEFSEWIVDLFEDMIEMKIECGVEVPCYPQMRPMIDQFTSLLTDEERCREPYRVKEGVRLPELEVMDLTEHECKKACLSGPYELSLALFDEGRGDIMKKIGESLKRLVQGEDLEVVSIDEPSLGFHRPFDFDVEDLIDAWNPLSEVDASVEIHLHSLYFQEEVCRSEVEVIDFPTAETERNLKLVDSDLLRDYDMKVRVGVSRTDIISEEKVTTPEKVAENLNRAGEVLGDLIEFCGPDCGLGNVGSVDLARLILENTSSGVELYRDQ